MNHFDFSADPKSQYTTMEPKPTLAFVLTSFMQRDKRSAKSLAAQVIEVFSHGPSATTINRWRRGEVETARLWQDLVKIGHALRLTKGELNDLLDSSSSLLIDKLLSDEELADEDHQLLERWATVGTIDSLPLQLPPRITSFVGRDGTVQQLLTNINQSKRSTLVALIGVGGVGKTGLAIELAYRLQTRFPDGILWTRVSQADTMTVLFTIAEAYGVDVSGQTDVESRSSKVRHLLADKHALLILDDAQSDEQIRPLLPPSGKCVTLITTRRHDLAVASHAQRVVVEPFDQTQQEARRFFARKLQGTPLLDEQEALDDIAKLLGHLPLALTIAANRMQTEPHNTAAKFLARLKNEQRLTQLNFGDQSIRASFEVSYAALSPELQRVFASLGIFADGDFSLTAVAHLHALDQLATEDQLTTLVQLSLLQPSRIERYQLHPLLRDFARGYLERAAFAERYAAYFCGLPIEQQSNFALLQLELANILQALTIAQARDDAALYCRAVRHLYPFMKTRGLYALVQPLLETAVAWAQANDLADDLAYLLTYRGQVAEKQGA